MQFSLDQVSKHVRHQFKKLLGKRQIILKKNSCQKCLFLWLYENHNTPGLVQIYTLVCIYMNFSKVCENSSGNTVTHNNRTDACQHRVPERSILQLKGGLLNHHDTLLLCCFGKNNTETKRTNLIRYVLLGEGGLQAPCCCFWGCLTLTLHHRKLHDI